MQRSLRPLLALALVLACAGAALAQRDKAKDDGLRSLQGQVLDPDNKAAVSAVVQLKDMRTLVVRSYVTQEKGEYHFSGLRTDTDYEIKANYNGMNSDTKRLSVFDSRKTATINLKLQKK
jgi:Carboxypeptidase regulatory-like domain